MTHQSTTNVFDLLMDAKRLIERASEGIDPNINLGARRSLADAVTDASTAVGIAITETRNQIGREYEPGPRAAKA